MLVRPVLEFPRTPRRSRVLQLTPLIDIVFILIIFFMLTTSFMKIESMELTLPGSGGKGKSRMPVTPITLQNDGGMVFDREKMDSAALEAHLTPLLKQKNERRVLVLVEDKVPLKTLVAVMDRIYLLGGKNVFVKALPAPVPEEKTEAVDGVR